MKTLGFTICDTRRQAGLECRAQIFTPLLCTRPFKDLRMSARYQHLSPAFLAEAVGRLDAVFGEYRYQVVSAPKLLALAATSSSSE